MTVSSFLPRQTLALHKVIGYRTEQDRHLAETIAPTLHSFTVALSREAGTPAAEIARAVGQQLGWPVYDRELVESVARELHLPLSVIEEIDERGQSWLLECLEAFVARPKLTQERYFHCLLGVVRRLGEQGGSILVGRGAAHILSPHSTLRVLLIGSCDDRISAYSRRFHLERGAAARIVAEVSRDRGRFIREHFHTEPTKAQHYDLVLNTSQWPTADCADFIVQALHHKAGIHRQG